MKLAKITLLAALLVAAASLAFADTITSTAGGGFWSDGTTWEDGYVPTSGDDVVIAGPVQVDGSVPCRNLTVNPAGALTAALQAPPIEVLVSGSVNNLGTIDDGTVWMEMEIGGDLHNAGYWNNHVTTLTGIGDREMSDTSADGFVCEFEVAAAATGDIIMTTPVILNSFVDFADLRVILQPGSHLTLVGSIFTADVVADGNELRFQAWSYLFQCNIDDAVLVGDAKVASATFTTRVTVQGTLQNTTATGGGAAIVQGDLINHGVIQNDNYSFFFQVHGNVENHGTLDMPNLEMMGVDAEHRLFMGPDAALFANVFMPEFQPSTLIAETPVTFGGGLGLGIGTLILEPGASLHFSQHSGLGSGTVMANGNTISTEDGNSGLSNLTIDNGVIGDYAAVFSEVLFTRGLKVAGTLTGWPWAAADLTVEGLLLNEGTISDGDYPVHIIARNDIQNLGVMDNARVILAGTTDQTVGAGPGIAVPEFVLASGFSASSYQWHRNGEELPGDTGPDLILNTVHAADYGRYHCEGDGQISRYIFIAETLGVTDVPDLASTLLEQNHPNPFNPATEIAFSLDQPGPVLLLVYDLAGREVDRLVAREMGAGRHVVTWEPRGLASGTYVYRLRADGLDVVRKCSLLK